MPWVVLFFEYYTKRLQTYFIMVLRGWQGQGIIMAKEESRDYFYLNDYMKYGKGK